VTPLLSPTRSPHEARRLGLLGGLGILVLIGAAALWTSRDQTPTDSSDKRSAKTKMLSPPEIAGSARTATVQVRAFDSDRRLVGQGTGFFVGSNGTIATNLHVIRDARSLEIETSSGDVYDLVYLVAADARRDLAILKVPIDDAKPLQLATDAELDVGEAVYVMGNPLGQVGTFSNGLVSAQRVVDGVSLVQITAPVSPGSSGGPVMNARGEAVGVATLMLRGGQNLNYAVPIRYVRPLLSSPEAPRLFSNRLLPSAIGGLAQIPDIGGGESRSTAAPSGGRTTYDGIAVQFRTVDSVVRVRGGHMLSQIVRGSLGNGGENHHEMTLVAGNDYLIAGYCDDDCTDLDLSVRDLGRQVITSDIENDDYPRIRFRAPASGRYDLIVTMSACSVPPCAYGVRLYRM